MHQVLRTCPSCGGELIITELSCTTCETVIRGRYTTSAFEQLSAENLRFLELFVASRGNIKEMERETGLGYWTIRGRLDDLIEELHLGRNAAPPEEIAPPDAVAPPGAIRPPDAKKHRRAILEAVVRGELSVAEAERQLRHLP
jgi:hypothetical protein